jgi:hypothetical protein
VDAPYEPDQWEFITFDPETVCPICGKPIHAAQAVGYCRGEMIHARCAEPSRPS